MYTSPRPKTASFRQREEFKGSTPKRRRLRESLGEGQADQGSGPGRPPRGPDNLGHPSGPSKIPSFYSVIARHSYFAYGAGIPMMGFPRGARRDEFFRGYL
ncbi:Uncharacterized protein TCM_004277 [Theobroma cacao]|uniref:Uncharacterized protein n=1 Tax=Theobroma cacao TaxID=3641 RepID=A0A061DXD8_THECC|nr:Uncharacterized protein TCM_004277 [Theobroma cacao]